MPLRTIVAAVLVSSLSSGLRVQTPTPEWVFLDGPAWSFHTAAYDWVRGRLVTFGAEGATWEFPGGQMLSRYMDQAAGSAPPPRARGAMAYDLERQHVLMFGGIRDGTVVNETWVWDGRRWTQLTAGPVPPPRVDCGIVYDLNRARVVMFGGQSLPGQYSDTWEHDGSRWITRTPATVPGPNSPVMAHDFLRARTVMVTSPGIRGQPVTTWEWDGLDWSRRATTGPTTSSNYSMAYDPIRQRTVLIGGVPDASQVWEWDGAAWRVAATIAAPLRLSPAVYFDPRRGAVSIFGGRDFRVVAGSIASGAHRTDIWEWRGNNMLRLTDDLRPLSRYGHTLASDPGRGEVLVFGGIQAQAPSNDTWTWDGNLWSRRNPATSPEPRSNATAVSDLAGNRVLVFGGAGGGQFRNDLWAWDGVDWQLLDDGNGTAPSPRTEAGMAFDAVRAVTLLFGGSAGPLYQAGSLRNDTWAWDGARWTQLVRAVAPSPREGAAMTFDYRLARVVLFGGRVGATASDQLNDTWEWNGSQWRRVMPSVSPPALLSPSLVFDTANGRTILTGVEINNNVGTFHVWSYDGTSWRQLDTDANLQLRGRSVWDRVRERIVTHDGTVLAEWTTEVARAEAYGAGCGPYVPRLMARTRPRIGDAGFGFETLVYNGQAVVFAAALARRSQVLGNGCTLLLAGTPVTSLAVADPAGLAELPLPLPASVSLRGLVLYAQLAALDPASPGGFSLSHGLRVRVGD